MTQLTTADQPQTQTQNRNADFSLPARSALDCGRSATALPTSTLPPTVHAPSEQPSAFAFPPLTSSSLPSSEAKGGRFIGRRISPRFLSESPRTFTSPPVVRHLIISNRSARRLEMPETYTKQRTDPLSNRHKFTHSHTTSSPTSSQRPTLPALTHPHPSPTIKVRRHV